MSMEMWSHTIQFAADYTPRDGSKETPIGQANNQYLEKPYLHYTIGTRVTPHVVKDLKDEGVSTNHSQQGYPGFSSPSLCAPAHCCPPIRTG